MTSVYSNKSTYRFLAIFLLLSLIFISNAHAEKIYLKDGKIIQKKIASRSRGCIWFKYGSGSTGIELKLIGKITNDDGSISKYDYEALGKAIHEAIAHKEYAKASGLCGLLIESFPNYPPTRHMRGDLSYKLGNFKDAAEDYEFLVKHNRADAKMLNNLGTIYAGEKRYPDAQNSFLQAIAMRPDMVEAHNNLANISMSMKDYATAIIEYDKVLRIEPSNADALFNLGLAYQQTGNNVRAKEKWEKVLLIKPDDDSTKKALQSLIK